MRAGYQSAEKMRQRYGRHAVTNDARKVNFGYGTDRLLSDAVFLLLALHARSA